MAPLPGLNKGVFQDPAPPLVDFVLSPITIPNGTTLVTTKTTNETIANVDELIDYVSGDNGPNFIPQVAIDNLVSDLALKEDAANKGAVNGYAGLDASQELLLANFPTGIALQVLRRNAANTALEFATISAGGGQVNSVVGTTNRISVDSADPVNPIVDIDAAYVGQSSITTLGTITTGVWNGTAITGANINAALTDLTDVTAKTGSGTVVVMDTSPTIVTPTIASFVNAIHNHQDAAGGGQLDSTLALSDTADIAYLNTANTYVAGNRQSFVADASSAAINLNAFIPTTPIAGDIFRSAEILRFTGTSLTDYILVSDGQPTSYTAGVRQDFLGLLAGTSGLNVGGIAGNPTTQVDGDIWLNTTSNTLFGRINGADVNLGAGAGGGEANTISSLGGGTVLTAIVPKSGVNLQIVSIATTAPIAHVSAADLITFSLNPLVDADISATAEIAVSKLADGNPGQFIRTDAAGTGVEYADDIASITFIIDGGGTVLTTGVHGDLEIPYNCTIERVTLLADQTGDVEIDLFVDTFANYPPVVGDSIVAAAPPTITTDDNSQDATLTGWTTALASGSTIRYNINSVTIIERVTIALLVRKTG